MGPGPRLAAPLSQLGSARVPLLSLAGEPRVHISVRVRVADLAGYFVGFLQI